jgi:hypothetical protein
MLSMTLIRITIGTLIGMYVVIPNQYAYFNLK